MDERIIELTIDSETVWYKNQEPSTEMATYTSTPGDWYVFPDEITTDKFIIGQSQVDSTFSGGNPTSIPPKPF